MPRLVKQPLVASLALSSSPAAAMTSARGIMDKTQVIFTTPQRTPGDPQIVRKILNSRQ